MNFWFSNFFFFFKSCHSCSPTSFLAFGSNLKLNYNFVVLGEKWYSRWKATSVVSNWYFLLLFWWGHTVGNLKLRYFLTPLDFPMNRSMTPTLPATALPGLTCINLIFKDSLWKYTLGARQAHGREGQSSATHRRWPTMACEETSPTWDKPPPLHSPCISWHESLHKPITSTFFWLASLVTNGPKHMCSNRPKILLVAQLQPMGPSLE